MAENPARLAAAASRVSVLGVARNGVLNAADSTALAFALGQVMGSGLCEPGYGEALRAQNAPALVAIDSAVAKNGLVGDELFESVAGAALGDYVVLAQIYADPSTITRDATRAKPVLVAHHVGRAQIHGDRHRGPHEEAELEGFADLFSVRDGRVEATFALVMDSSDVRAALRELAKTVQSKLPNAKCDSWRWASVRVDHTRDMLGMPLPTFRLVPSNSH